MASKIRRRSTALLQYMEEQGLIPRKPTIEELFVPSTLRPVPVDEGHPP